MLIHKLQLNAVTYEQTRVISTDAKILSIKIQYGEPVVYYATKDPAVKTEKRFYAVMTGAATKPEAEFIDTLIFDDGDFVVHFFVEK